ncbi:hypothetical protein TNCT_546891 [Trichonephila clavata]|uniref:Uncharacterized protein n=1 Tax=Trichonephila clavata TaxID=2740835 RepID=A0A8X6GUQ9_TRICU|nr:hypothetical protein TNCT_546891 [Trichonephila clavata]
MQCFGCMMHLTPTKYQYLKYKQHQCWVTSLFSVSIQVVRESCTSDEWLQSDQEDELIRLLSEQSEAVDDIDTTPLLVH